MITKKSQAQRKRERDKQDRLNSIECAKRAGHCCELCNRLSTYGQNHHLNGKKTTELRNDPDNWIWLCGLCHVHVHEKPWVYKEKISEIVNSRIDNTTD